MGKAIVQGMCILGFRWYAIVRFGDPFVVLENDVMRPIELGAEL